MSYEYRHAKVTRLIDGDTIELDIDLGNFLHWTRDFRLNGINTPERKQPGFLEATEHLRVLLSAPISRVVTYKPSKFGMWLTDIWVLGPDSGELHVNRLMVTDGLAQEYHGGKR